MHMYEAIDVHNFFVDVQKLNQCQLEQPRKSDKEVILIVHFGGTIRALAVEALT